MSRGLQAEFYSSKVWQECREAYKKKAGGLCEVCKSKGIITAGVIVHHKKHINSSNVKDPNITLNFDNLMLVCEKCHGKEHGKKKRYSVSADGTIIPRE